MDFQSKTNLSYMLFPNNSTSKGNNHVLKNIIFINFINSSSITLILELISSSRIENIYLENIIVYRSITNILEHH